jgi:pimeloyl-ACP methyl ester carboxylesterase
MSSAPEGAAALHAKRYPAEAPPLLILHGFLGSGGNWSTLARTRFSGLRDVYALDARNHGRSPHTDAFSYALMAADVVAFLDANGLQQADVLGHSMGGKTAMTLALAHPDRVRSLIVADMAPRAYPPGHHELLAALSGLDLAQIDSRQDADARLAGSVPDWGVRQFLLKNLDRTPGGYAWAANLDALVRQYDEVLRAIDGTPFEGPALFVRGARSGYVRDSDLPEVERLFPAAQLVTIPDAGHWVHAEAPDAFADAVVGFLRETDG